MPPLAGFAVLAVCALVLIRIIRRGLVSPRWELEAEARVDELLPRLLPYAYRGDRARLIAEFGSVSGLRALRRSCRATAALIECGEDSGIIQAQARAWSVQARWLIRGAVVEVWVRRIYPAWSPVLLIASVQVYCEMACTYEALVNVV